MKKIIAIALCVSLSFSVAVLPAYAQDEVHFRLYRRVECEPSEYGYVNYKYVDENGKEVQLDINEAYGDLQRKSEDVCYAATTSVSVPDSYDLRDYGYVSPVTSQGSAGNCWAFACVASLESNSIMHGNSEYADTDFSEAHLVWFSKNSQSTDVNDLNYGEGYIVENPYSGSECAGNSDDVVAALSRWSGLAKESTYRFYPYSHSSMGNYDESVRYDKGSGVVIKSCEELLDDASIKQWIMENGAVGISYYSDKTMYNKATYAYNYNTEKISNHMVAIIGWDDNYSVDNFLPEYAPNSSGAWLCKNSWGDDWGNDGYFWISYEDMTLRAPVGFTTQKADDYTNNYTYNGQGYMSVLSAGYEPLYSNVFKAKNYEAITDVATYTLQPDTDVTVSIYTGLPEDYTSPVEGDLVATHSLRIKNGGYHTIHLPQEVLLEPGMIFSVVLKVSHDTQKPMLAFENDEKRNFVYHEGESFLSNNGGTTWRDMTYYYKSKISNVCVQALTKCVYTGDEEVYMNFKDNVIITPDNDFSYLKDNFNIFSKSDFAIKDTQQRELPFLVTGATLTVKQNDDTTTDFTVVVEGDTNGDGVCDVLDATETELGTNGHKSFGRLQCYAANGFVSEDMDLSAYQNVVNKALAS
ncbi:MAG: hypothetical protein E7530_00765 [Ruminococcaceae bacterium]|nr:hypothetical protein [Oscillospiraceae bacterium]